MVCVYSLAEMAVFERRMGCDSGLEPLSNDYVARSDMNNNR